MRQAPKTIDRARRRARRAARPGADQARHPVAAREEFVEYGLDGARVDRIAERGRRQQAHALPLRRQQGGALRPRPARRLPRHPRRRGRAPPRHARRRADAMEQLVGFTFDHFRANPWFIRLLATENIQRGAFVRAHAGHPRAALAARRPDRRRARRRRGRRHLPPGVDPVQLYITIAGVSYFYMSNIHTLSVDLRRPAGGGRRTWPRGGPRHRRRARLPAARRIRLRRNNQGVTFERRAPGEGAERSNIPGPDIAPILWEDSDDYETDPAQLRRPAGGRRRRLDPRLGRRLRRRTAARSG